MRLSLQQIKRVYRNNGCWFIITDHALKRMKENDRHTTISDIHNIIKSAFKTSHHSIREKIEGCEIENLTCRITGFKLDGSTRQLAVKINKDGVLVIITVI